MSTDDVSPDVLAHATLSLLETRLRRLEFLLTGDGRPSASDSSDRLSATSETVHNRLQKLQSEVDDLHKRRGPAGNLVRDVESLRSKVPEIFAASNAASRPTTSDLSMTSSVVLSHASLFPETASRLSSLQSLQIPSAEKSSNLIELRHRINVALQHQMRLEKDAEDLQARSAKCLEWWVKVGVVGMGELWEDWETRVTDVERDLKRVERRKAMEDGLI